MMYTWYVARKNTGDEAGAKEICNQAADAGCSWPYDVGCFKVMQNNQGDFYDGPIIDMGHFWPPCPTPWGPGPRLKMGYVPDPQVGCPIKDPGGS